MRKQFWALINKEDNKIVYFYSGTVNELVYTMAIFDSRLNARKQKEDWQKVVKISINIED